MRGLNLMRALIQNSEKNIMALIGFKVILNAC